MEKPKITNIRLYETDDVWNALKLVLSANSGVKTLSIRHLMNPIPDGGINDAPDLWVQVERKARHRNGAWDSSHIEVAILHPDRYELPAMLVIARAADPEKDKEAYPQIATDLIKRAGDVLGNKGLAAVALRAPPTIRLRDKVAKSERVRNTYELAVERAESRRETVESRKRRLDAAINHRDQLVDEIAKLRNRIPEIILEVEALDAEVTRRKLKLDPAG